MKKTFLKIALTFIYIALVSVTQASELTIQSESSFNPTYENRFAIMAGFNTSLFKATDMTNFTFSYGKKFESYWLDTNFSISRGLFHKFSANNQSATGATNYQLQEQQNILATIGIGIGRETRYAQTLIPFNDIYELMAANLTYNSYKEGHSGKSFSGPGLLAKFSVYKKFGDYFSAGTHFNYNLAVLSRAKNAEIDTETTSQRSLTLGFLTVGIDLSFYL